MAEEIRNDTDTFESNEEDSDDSLSSFDSQESETSNNREIDIAMTKYLNMCQKLFIFPIKSIVEDVLLRLNVNCNNRGLGEKDITAISMLVEMTSKKDPHLEEGIRSSEEAET